MFEFVQKKGWIDTIIIKKTIITYLHIFHLCAITNLTMSKVTKAGEAF